MLTTLFTFAGSKLARVGAIIALILSFIAYVFSAGKKSQETDQKLKAAADAAKTRERINEAEPSSSVADAVDRLRSNGNLRN